MPYSTKSCSNGAAAGVVAKTHYYMAVFVFLLLPDLHLGVGTRSLFTNVDIAVDGNGALSTNTELGKPTDATVTGWLQQAVSFALERDIQGANITAANIQITSMSLPSGRNMLQLPKTKKLLLNALKKPFSQKKLSTSRSGATFYFSSDGKFILKKMPSSREFMVLAELEQEMGRYFAGVGNDVLRTSIDPILLSYATKGSCNGCRGFWALVGVESVSMAEAASTKDFEVRVVHRRSDETFTRTNGSTDTISMPMAFDVKPIPIGSDQRQPFFEYLEILTRGQGVGAFWENAFKQQQTILQDLKFLDSHHFIDYSVFFMFQKVTVTRLTRKTWDQVFHAMEEALPRCTWDVSRRSKDKVEAYFMCVAIIDYLMDRTTLTKFKEFENVLLRNKWDNWGPKVQELFVCMTDPCAKATRSFPRVYHVPSVGDVQHVNGCKPYRSLFARKVNKICMRNQPEEVMASVARTHVVNPLLALQTQ